jgi:hypothetical protein
LLAGSEIRVSHLTGDDRVQDPYSLRCQPQVVGACLDQLRHAALVLVREANAVTDNPLVFAAATGRARSFSGGNFHAEPVALGLRCLRGRDRRGRRDRRAPDRDADRRQRLAPAAVPDRRCRPQQRLHDRPRDGRGARLENKSLAHPASVDSLPTSANQEDHVSMATFAARRLQAMIHNTAHILGIELLAAAQGIEFLRPLRSSPPLEAAHALLRETCPPLSEDRYSPRHRARDRAGRRRFAGTHPANAAGAAAAVDSGLKRPNGRRHARSLSLSSITDLEGKRHEEDPACPRHRGIHHRPGFGPGDAGRDRHLRMDRLRAADAREGGGLFKKHGLDVTIKKIRRRTATSCSPRATSSARRRRSRPGSSGTRTASRRRRSSSSTRATAPTAWS